MATTKSNNFGSSFKSAVKRGTPAATAVWNISNKTGKTESVIWNWLFKNGFVNRKKFGGNWIYWPNFNFKAASNQNNKSFSFQQFINWAIGSGYCTPEQVNQLKSQKDFVNFFGPFFANQFGWNVASGWTPAKVKNFGKKSKSNAKPAPRKRTGTKRRASTSSRKSTAKRHTPKRNTRAKASSSRKRTGTSTRRARTTTARSRKSTSRSRRSSTRRSA